MIASGEEGARRTDDVVAGAVLAVDVDQVIDTVAAGQIAIIPTCLTYAIVGHTGPAIARIFTAKQRSYDKPCGCFGAPFLSRELHDLPPEKSRMVDAIRHEEQLPFSIVAPYRASHALLAGMDPFVIANATKGGTMDMVINGGPFVAALAARSFERGVLVFGSSANRSLGGSKYHLREIEPEVLEAASLRLDYGVSRWATPEGLSSTIIDMRDFTVVRIGHQYARLREAFARRFGVTLIAPKPAQA